MKSIIVKNAGGGRRMEILKRVQGESHWHTHMNHQERIFVLTGRMCVEWITRNGKVRNHDLMSGDTLVIEPGYSHRIVVLVDGTTAHSYRPAE